MYLKREITDDTADELLLRVPEGRDHPVSYLEACFKNTPDRWLEIVDELQGPRWPPHQNWNGFGYAPVPCDGPGCEHPDHADERNTP